MIRPAFKCCSVIQNSLTFSSRAFKPPCALKQHLSHQLLNPPRLLPHYQSLIPPLPVHSAHRHPLEATHVGQLHPPPPPPPPGTTPNPPPIPPGNLIPSGLCPPSNCGVPLNLGASALFMPGKAPLQRPAGNCLLSACRSHVAHTLQEGGSEVGREKEGGKRTCLV